MTVSFIGAAARGAVDVRAAAAARLSSPRKRCMRRSASATAWAVAGLLGVRGLGNAPARRRRAGACVHPAVHGAAACRRPFRPARRRRSRCWLGPAGVRRLAVLAGFVRRHRLWRYGRRAHGLGASSVRRVERHLRLRASTSSALPFWLSVATWVLRHLICLRRARCHSARSSRSRLAPRRLDRLELRTRASTRLMFGLIRLAGGWTRALPSWAAWNSISSSSRWPALALVLLVPLWHVAAGRRLPQLRAMSRSTNGASWPWPPLGVVMVVLCARPPRSRSSRSASRASRWR